MRKTLTQLFLFSALSMATSFSAKAQVNVVPAKDTIVGKYDHLYVVPKGQEQILDQQKWTINPPINIGNSKYLYGVVAGPQDGAEITIVPGKDCGCNGNFNIVSDVDNNTKIKTYKCDGSEVAEIKKVPGSHIEANAVCSFIITVTPNPGQ